MIGTSGVAKELALNKIGHAMHGLLPHRIADSWLPRPDALPLRGF